MWANAKDHKELVNNSWLGLWAKVVGSGANKIPPGKQIEDVVDDFIEACWSAEGGPGHNNQDKIRPGYWVPIGLVAFLAYGPPADDIRARMKDAELPLEYSTFKEFTYEGDDASEGGEGGAAARGAGRPRKNRSAQRKKQNQSTRASLMELKAAVSNDQRVREAKKQRKMDRQIVNELANMNQSDRFTIRSTQRAQQMSALEFLIKMETDADERAVHMDEYKALLLESRLAIQPDPIEVLASSDEEDHMELIDDDADDDGGRRWQSGPKGKGPARGGADLLTGADAGSDGADEIALTDEIILTDEESENELKAPAGGVLAQQLAAATSKATAAASKGGRNPPRRSNRHRGPEAQGPAKAPGNG